LSKERRYLMSYDEFIIYIIDEIRLRMGGDFQVQIHSVMKNNSVKLDGLVIMNKKEKITPNIYLSEFYSRYKDGEKMEDILDCILRIYNHSNSDQSNQFNLDFDYECIKDKIYYRIVNYKKNEILLAEMPHMRFLDLAVTFHCLVKDDAQGIGSIRITKDCVKNWNINVSELMKMAKRNTPILFPPSIRAMDDVIGEIIEDNTGFLNNNNSGDEFEAEKYSYQKDTLCKSENDMYIVSNSRGINGASVMLYKDVIRNFALLMNKDFYILPSSIHEIILVPCNHSIKKEVLEEMVFDINHTQVAEDEVLSNQVYYYNRKRNSFE
jgi:hypothetical protein